MTKKLTIPLTGRRPVSLSPAEWPIVAESWYYDYDGQYDFQSFRHWRGSLRARRHSDGRLIVYASRSFESAYQGERNTSEVAGVLRPSGADLEEGLAQVFASIPEDDEHRSWRGLLEEALASIAAEEI